MLADFLKLMICCHEIVGAAAHCARRMEMEAKFDKFLRRTMALRCIYSFSP